MRAMLAPEVVGTSSRTVCLGPPHSPGPAGHADLRVLAFRRRDRPSRPETGAGSDVVRIGRGPSPTSARLVRGGRSGRTRPRRAAGSLSGAGIRAVGWTADEGPVPLDAAVMPGQAAVAGPDLRGLVRRDMVEP